MLIALDPTEAKSGLNKSLNVMRFGTPFVLLVVHASDQSIDRTISGIGFQPVIAKTTG